MTGVILAVRILLSAIFLMSAMTKLMAPTEFAANVQRYRILPRPLATGHGFVLPYLELGAAGLMLSGYFLSLAAGLVSILLVSFILAITIALARRQNLDCSCFGLLYRERVNRGILLRDGVLLAMSIGLIFNGERSVGFDYIVRHPSNLGTLLH